MGVKEGFETEELGVVVLGFENLVPSRVNENVYREPESEAFAEDNKLLTCFVHYCGVPFREEAMFQLSVQVFAQVKRLAKRGEVRVALVFDGFKDISNMCSGD